MYVFCFFFFKQKTAYEMRISDWSSDVCSSDLSGVGDAVEHRCGDAGAGTVDEGIASSIEPAIDEPIFDLLDRRTVGMAIEIVPAAANEQQGGPVRVDHGIGIESRCERAAFGAADPGQRLREIGGDQRAGALDRRSEEHTSELQSLMRISYAV